MPDTPANEPSGNRVPRTFTVWNCFDCGWVGNRPEMQKDVQYGWEEPWDEYYCPECGETAGADFEVREVCTAGVPNESGADGTQ